jgi:hypothetical protein
MMKAQWAGFLIFSLLFLVPVYPILSGAETGESVEHAVIREINSIRSGEGLQSLKIERSAAAAAFSHAGELGERMTLSHRGLDGTRVNDRYRLAGGTALKTGENLGAGDSVDSIIKAWLVSPAHRSNILSPDWFHVGVGFSRLAGGRIVLVVVFSDSRWEQIAVTLSGKNLIISGKLVLRHGTDPEEINLILGDFSYPPFLAQQYTRDEMEIVFKIPRADIKDSKSQFSYFLNLVEKQESRFTDLVIVDSPITL